MRDALKGIGIVLGFHFVQVLAGAALLLSGLETDTGLLYGAYVALGFGLLQLVYVVPAAVVYDRRGQRDTVQGILMTAGFTLLLNLAFLGYWNRGAGQP